MNSRGYWPEPPFDCYPDSVPFRTCDETVSANVAELADAPDLGSGGRKVMGVRPSPFAPLIAVNHLRFLLTWPLRRPLVSA